ncbi:MAG: hypothetical protein ACREHD_12865 [Pirellulales bacterium]
MLTRPRFQPHLRVAVVPDEGVFVLSGSKETQFASGQWKKAQELSKLDEKARDREFMAMTKDNERFIAETLTKDQRKRLDEILLQVAGLLWVTRPEIAKKLDLTEEQKKKAAQLQKEARQEMEELIHSTSDAKKDEELAELRQTSRQRLQSLLTDKQKSKWKEMSGEPLKGKLSFAEKQSNKR